MGKKTSQLLIPIAILWKPQPEIRLDQHFLPLSVLPQRLR
jgi:hypothetical protein